MSLIKLQVNVPEIRKALEVFRNNRKKALESLVKDVRQSVAGFMNDIMNAEMALFLGEPDQSDNRRNGFSERDYAVKGLGALRVRIPQDRQSRFQSVVVPPYERRDPRLDEDMAALQLGGLSNRTLALMGQRILGVKVSHQTVSSSLSLLKEEAQKWLVRPITNKYWALIIDGAHFAVRRRGSVAKEPRLVVLGIDERKRRSILAIEPGARDDVNAWRAVFRSLKERGLDAQHVQLGVMDGLPGLENLFREEFASSVTGRCWFHALGNAVSKAPERLQNAFEIMAKKVMYADGYSDAKDAFAKLKETFGTDCQRSVACLEKDLESLLTHYRFDKGYWVAIRTTNGVERIHKECRRRTRAMEAMGETTLDTVLVFTALRMEMAWQRRAVDTYETSHLIKKPQKHVVIEVLEGEKVLN
jgi:putative transposase